MDMGLDVNGHLWVIEINSKPGVFDEKEIRQRHVSLLHDYFEYLIENRTAGKKVDSYGHTDYPQENDAGILLLQDLKDIWEKKQVMKHL